MGFSHTQRKPRIKKGSLSLSTKCISVADLKFKYDGGEQALKGIDLEIEKGEYIAILGANGAGKTTFLLHMNGILPVVLGGQMSGTVHVCGMEPYEEHVFDVAKKVGMVLQDPEAQLFSSDVITEVAFAAENRAIPREEMMELIDWSLEAVRLKDFKYGTPAELSGGQKQRLVIASNLVIRPDIMALDEPTSQLDPIGTLEVFSSLRDLNKEFGMTILIATHKVDQIVEYADRIMVLEDGKLIMFDEPRKVFCQEPRLKQAKINCPDIAELDYKLRKFGIPERIGLVEKKEANLQVKEVAEVITKAIDQHVITPGKTYEKGLGRGISETPDGAGEPIVEVKNVSYRYSEKGPIALDDVSMSINKGEVVGIIGQNGAGKTTLMKCITRLLKPIAGSITIAGKDVGDLTTFETTKLVGLILQNPDNQLFQLSAEEEIQFGLRNLQLSESEIEERITEALELTGLQDHRKTYPFKLSLGDRRKLAVASIYAMHPEILIFDEPTTGQDNAGRYQLCDLAMRLNRQGTTIIMITHDMSLVAKYTQRTYVMGRSKLLLEAPTRDVFRHQDILEQTYLEAPPMVKLAQNLKGYGFPQDILTVEEMVDFLMKDSQSA